MDNSVYIIQGAAYNILQAIPMTESGNNVTIDIYNVSDSTVDTASTAMTFVNGETWKYAFTPSDTDDYLATIHDQTLDVKYYKYLRAVTSVPNPGSSSTDGSTLTVLRKEFLLSIDEYNSDDLTGDGSVGDRATACINQALQKIYGLIKDTKYLAAYPSTAISTTANQDYVELSGISDLDDVEQVSETTNDVVLRKMPYWRIREFNIDASENKGNPQFYARLFNRLYFSPTPDSAIELTIQYRKLIADLSGDSDQSALPSKYNYWIYAEAHIYWQRMQDISDTASLQNIVAIADDARTTAMSDIRSEFDTIDVSDSNFTLGDSDGFHSRFDSPVGN